MRTKRSATVALVVCLFSLVAHEALAFYNPETGRWLSRDPIEERGGLNLYVFVQNNPVSKWDYLGRSAHLAPLNGEVFNYSSATVTIDGDWKEVYFYRESNLPATMYPWSYADYWSMRWNVPPQGEKSKLAGESISSMSSLSNLLALPTDALQRMDIAQMNVLCAQGLPGAEELDVNRCLTALDEMADRVRLETERHLYRFRQNTVEFENSEGYFRMIMLAVVLAEDFHVKYAPIKIGAAAEAHVGDGFFGNAEDVECAVG